MFVVPFGVYQQKNLLIIIITIQIVIYDQWYKIDQQYIILLRGSSEVEKLQDCPLLNNIYKMNLESPYYYVERMY